MNWEYPNHLGDIVKNEAPADTRELSFSMGNKSPGYVLLWLLKAIIIMAREIELLKQRTP